MSFEEKLAKLEETIGFLEQKDIPLEKAIENYETGIKLLKECYGKLNAAENRLKVIVKNSEKELNLADFTPGSLSDIEKNPNESTEKNT